MLTEGIDNFTRGILFGLLIAVFPIAQFFGAPLIGAYSDRVGRKKAMILSLAGTALGYLLMALGIFWKNIPLIFFGRVVVGFAGGNIAVAMSAIADMSDAKTKAGNFALIGMSFGLGFIMGPFIGGKLSDPSLVSWFDFSTPFFFAALLSALNTALVFLIFRETLTESVFQIEPHHWHQEPRPCIENGEPENNIPCHFPDWLRLHIYDDIFPSVFS